MGISRLMRKSIGDGDDKASYVPHIVAHCEQASEAGGRGRSCGKCAGIGMVEVAGKVAGADCAETTIHPDDFTER